MHLNKHPPMGWRIFPWVSALLVFWLFTGGGILNPTHLDWLMAGDPAQHWIGWQFFRDTPLLQWPLGANRNLGMELGSSIVFSDSIPLAAFFFKCLNPLLPEQFQYFGLWALLCFCLQAYFAWKLLHRFSPSHALTALGTLFFLIAPVFLYRFHAHIALSSHWTLLAGLYLYTSPDFRNRPWAVLLAAASLIHAYLLAMLLALWVTDLVQRKVSKQMSLGRAAVIFAANLVMLALVAWAAGYFMVGNGVAGSGYGIYRLNLLAIFDGDTLWSTLMPDFPAGAGDYEGFSFLGTGILVLAAAAMVTAALKRPRHMNKGLVVPLALLCGGLFVYALSNHVAAGNHELFSYPLPRHAMKLTETFRASGRFFWPVYYALYLLVFWLLFTQLKRAIAITLCSAALILQAADMTDSWIYFSDRYETAPQWQSPMSAPIWNEFPHHYSRMVLVLPSSAPRAWLELSRYAATNHVRTNAVYFARVNSHKLEKVREELITTVTQGTFRDDTLYIFENDRLWDIANSRRTERDVAATVDGFKFLAPGLKQCNTCDWTGTVSPDRARGQRPFSTGVLTFTADGTGSALPSKGWAPADSAGRWSEGELASIQLNPVEMDTSRTLELLIDGNALVSRRHPKQRIDISINGTPAAKVQYSFSNPSGVRRVILPREVSENLKPPLTIELRLPDATSPQALGMSEDARQLGLNLKSIELRSLEY